MGKVMKWLKGLFTIKQNNGRRSGSGVCTPEAAWRSSYYGHSGGKEHSNRAIAIAAATAAAADAAAAAAHAAAAVVRLTSGERGGPLFCRERLAAVKIQAAFRGYLARKALRCLKGLVKIQALLRGYLVRKQASATLHSMQALMRAQATVLAQNSRPTIINHPQNSIKMDTAVRSKTRRSRRSNTWSWVSQYQDDPFAALHSSPLPYQIPNSQDFDTAAGVINNQSCPFLTPQTTPRFGNSVTMPKSVFVEPCFRMHNEGYPKYMASTQSFMSKMRSQSAPKQRPEAGPGRKRVSVNEMMESRASQSGVRMHKSCSPHAQEVMNFKSVVIGRLGRFTDYPYMK